MRTQKRSNQNVTDAKKRKQFHKGIGGAISPDEMIRFGDGSVGNYAGKRNFDNSGRIILLECYDVLNKAEAGAYEGIRELPTSVYIGSQEYKIALMPVEKPTYNISRNNTDRNQRDY